MKLSAAAAIAVRSIPFHLTPQGTMKMDGRAVKSESLIPAILQQLPAEAEAEFLENLPRNYLGSSVGDALKAEIRNLIPAPKRPVNPDGVYFNDEIPTPVSKLKYIVNLYEGSKSFIYDPVEDRAYRYDHEIILPRLKKVLGKDNLDNWMSTNSMDCRVAYRPDVRARIIDDEKPKVFNTWVEAEWKKNWGIPAKKTNPPQLFKDFMRALFPTADDRRSAAAWLRDCTFDRAEPILVLSGAPGVGKNLFVEYLARALVGGTNYRAAARGFGKSYFHANVSQCRVFFLDEMNLTHDARESLKSYHNGLATIERKGVDNADPEPIHASFAVANNYPKYIKLEYSDRKFFVPELTNTKLTTTLGQSKIDEFTAALDTSPEFLQDIASYLHSNFTPGSAQDFKKNEKFRALCIGSYPLTFQRFITACAENSEISGKKFNRAQGRKLCFLELKEHIQHYEIQFGEELATTVEVDGTWTAVSKKYKPEPAPLPVDEPMAEPLRH